MKVLGVRRRERVGRSSWHPCQLDTDDEWAIVGEETRDPLESGH